MESIVFPNMITGGEKKVEITPANQHLLYKASGYNIQKINNRGFEMIDQYFSYVE